MVTVITSCHLLFSTQLWRLIWPQHSLIRHFLAQPFDSDDYLWASTTTSIKKRLDRRLTCSPHTLNAWDFSMMWWSATASPAHLCGMSNETHDVIRFSAWVELRSVLQIWYNLIYVNTRDVLHYINVTLYELSVIMGIDHYHRQPCHEQSGKAIHACPQRGTFKPYLHNSKLCFQLSHRIHMRSISMKGVDTISGWAHVKWPYFISLIDTHVLKQ
jgi:hypothetical protein